MPEGTYLPEFQANTDQLNKDFKAWNDALTELKRARSLFGPMHSAHEGLAVIMEEMDELKEHVWMNQKKRNMDAMYKECIQVAAMALKFASDICLSNNRT